MEYKFGDKSLIFTPEVIKTFESYRQIELRQHEAGGILLGRVYEYEKIIIEQISTPTSEDKSGRYFFDRSVQKAQRIVTEAWQESKGEIRYLGECHTHPEATPTPSSVDRKLIKGMLNDTKMDIDFLFLVIIGMRDLYVASQRKGKKLTQLCKK
ncbi:Mov34/MPN/PAD-1 family protein [Paenibacillus sp. GP183]|jgi:integrative and conjugative element protein (TIGR02256 family)|uniref:Mov34/MPN/PAD-1 family protein n=1 Tax=Paenibacillus sp. GP183 TaxID=1882751 RepID=UPI00089D1718|nr:Mov34/MPN/PAD-1 family protein [Paenibacillus sp. GP183]SEB74176.1 integrative and conjugative element protein, VC0181 family [Paenibacillus sp. GP183]